MNDEEEQSVRAAIDGELRLLAPGIRASPALAAELLDPEYVEFGESGREGDRASILAAIAPAEDTPADRNATSDTSPE
ncbi:hypothetical protein AB0K49_01420 [Streptomyces decoyicus]|uniref:hypothetical protein n=1 Tax=Streptomyces decoyicus TaxID=249567 RepID=UPI00345DFEDA